VTNFEFNFRAGSTIINGDLANNGSIRIFESSSVSVQGTINSFSPFFLFRVSPFFLFPLSPFSSFPFFPLHYLFCTYVFAGNYIQVPPSTFAVFNLSNSLTRPTNLVVNGTAYINGAFFFSFFSSVFLSGSFLFISFISCPPYHSLVANKINVGTLMSKKSGDLTGH
jgi:hypothetical protein